MMRFANSWPLIYRIQFDQNEMMSLLYQRRIAFSEELTALPGRFQKWFNGIEHRP